MSPTRRMTVAVAAGLFLVTSPAGSRISPRRTGECNPTSITVKEISNFHKVDNDLYRGGHPSCAGLEKLEGLGVRTFIDLGGAEASLHHCKAGTANRIEFTRFKISLPDIVLLGVSDERLQGLFAFMQKAPKPIFISCSLGRDRTGLVTAIYRMRRGEMSFHEAKEEALRYGYRTRFIGLEKALDRFRDPQTLQRLPAPSRTEPPPESVCRAKPLATAKGEF